MGLYRVQCGKRCEMPVMVTSSVLIPGHITTQHGRYVAKNWRNLCCVSWDQVVWCLLWLTRENSNYTWSSCDWSAEKLYAETKIKPRGRKASRNLTWAQLRCGAFLTKRLNTIIASSSTHYIESDTAISLSREWQLKYCESITSRLKYYVVNVVSIVILSIMARRD